MTSRSLALTCTLALSLATSAPLVAQVGPPGAQAPAAAGPKLPPPTVFPAPGSYPTTESITLRSADPDATIHYTWDGSVPNATSPVYDPLRLLFIAGLYDGNTGLKAGYTLRAVAIKAGMTSSDPATFLFTIDRRDRTAYVSEEVLPGVRMVRDSDNDKMFLIQGRNRNVLVDSGLGRGDLRAYLAQFTGGRPTSVIFTHSHGDHIGQADQLVADSSLYIGEADRPGLVRLLQTRGVTDDVIQRNVHAATDGLRVDLGDRAVVVYATPGHTPGSVVVFDEGTGNLFTGDSFGSNSPTIPDALWMQGVQTPLDGYLSVVKSLRSRLKGKIKTVMTGHNDRPLAGETYLSNLEAALQKLMDEGDAALVPSYRPANLSQVVIGDRFTDPDWVAVNVNKARYLPAPVEKIASLATLDLQGAALDRVFAPGVHEYAATIAGGARTVQLTASAISSRAVVTFDGKPAPAGGVYTLPAAARTVVVTVTSPDKSTTTDYRLQLRPAAR